MTDNLARHRALVDLERRYDGLPPPYERAAAIRGARTERENLEHDLDCARWASAEYWDAHVKPFAYQAMRARRVYLRTWSKAHLANWKRARRDIDFYLSGGKAGERREWAALRDRVHGLERRLAALVEPAPTNGREAQ